MSLSHKILWISFFLKENIHKNNHITLLLYVYFFLLYDGKPIRVCSALVSSNRQRVEIAQQGDILKCKSSHFLRNMEQTTEPNALTIVAPSHLRSETRKHLRFNTTDAKSMENPSRHMWSSTGEHKINSIEDQGVCVAFI